MTISIITACQFDSFFRANYSAVCLYLHLRVYAGKLHKRWRWQLCETKQTPCKYDHIFLCFIRYLPCLHQKFYLNGNFLQCISQQCRFKHFLSQKNQQNTHVVSATSKPLKWRPRRDGDGTKTCYSARAHAHIWKITSGIVSRRRPSFPSSYLKVANVNQRRIHLIHDKQNGCRICR